MKLYDSEIKVMNVLWKRGSLKASEIVKIMQNLTDWNKNTTYTVIKKCVDKGAIERREPGFLCVPIIDKIDVQKKETQELIGKMFSGSRTKFLSCFLSQDDVSDSELDEMENLIKRYKEEK